MKSDILIYLADPVGGGPKAPNGVDQTAINNVWGYWLWGIIIVGTFALAGCAILAWKNSRNNEGNEGVEKAAKIIGALIAIGLVPGIIGTVTGV
jgi:hypothetical protein